MKNNDSVYDELIEKQRKWIYGLPGSEYLLPIMKLRMSPDEAAFLLKIPISRTLLNSCSKLQVWIRATWRPLLMPWPREGWS